MEMDELYIKMYNLIGCKYFCKGDDEQLKRWGNSEQEIRKIKIDCITCHLQHYKDGIETYKVINELCGGKNNF